MPIIRYQSLPKTKNRSTAQECQYLHITSAHAQYVDACAVDSHLSGVVGVLHGELLLGRLEVVQCSVSLVQFAAGLGRLLLQNPVCLLRRRLTSQAQTNDVMNIGDGVANNGW